MATSVLIDEDLEIPFVGSLAEFRRWAVSDRFPERGRIDYLRGRIEVDMSPEDLGTHGKPKGRIYRVLDELAERFELGEVFVDSARISCPETGLSAEPDIVFVSHRSLETGRARLVPKARAADDRFVELEGPPDLVVEVVSDSSVQKDMERLPEAYWQSGIPEFWQVDARCEPIVFRILHHGPQGYVAAPHDAEGFQRSAVINVGFRLTRRRGRSRLWNFDLEWKPA